IAIRRKVRRCTVPGLYREKLIPPRAPEQCEYSLKCVVRAPRFCAPSCVNVGPGALKVEMCTDPGKFSCDRLRRQNKINAARGHSTMRHAGIFGGFFI